MSRCGNLWAVGFDSTGRAAEVRDEITRLAWEKHQLILLDVAVAVATPTDPSRWMESCSRS